MAYTYDEQIISDLHKDARGYRPREGFWAMWKEALPAGKQLIWDNLLTELEESMEADRVRDELAVAEFESVLEEIQKSMNVARDAAIRAYVDSLNIDEHCKGYGASYICFEAGLPYSMAQLFVEAGAATHIG